jgi:hypothetical protein
MPLLSAEEVAAVKIGEKSFSLSTVCIHPGQHNLSYDAIHNLHDHPEPRKPCPPARDWTIGACTSEQLARRCSSQQTSAFMRPFPQLYGSVPTQGMAELSQRRPVMPEKLFFIYGVTRRETHWRVMHVRDTWERQLPAPIVWYTDEYDPVIGGHITTRQPYKNVTWRFLEVYRHVAHHYCCSQGYSWYIRTWDDSFLFMNNILSLVARHDPSLPVELGRMHGTPSPVHTPFVDGGASSLLSRAGVALLRNRCDDCMRWWGRECVYRRAPWAFSHTEQPKNEIWRRIPEGSPPPDLGSSLPNRGRQVTWSEMSYAHNAEWNAEDLIFSRCKLRLGVRLISTCGLHHDTHIYSDAAARCNRVMSSDPTRHPEWCTPLSFHNVANPAKSNSKLSTMPGHEQIHRAAMLVDANDPSCANNTFGFPEQWLCTATSCPETSKAKPRQPTKQPVAAPKARPVAQAASKAAPRQPTTAAAHRIISTRSIVGLRQL